MTIDRNADVATAAGSWWAAGVAVLVVFLVLHVPAYLPAVVNQDEATAASLAMEMARGEDLYVDIVDRKPPGMQVLYVASIELTGSSSLVPVRLLMLGCVVAAAAVLAVNVTDRRDEQVFAFALFLLGTTTMGFIDAHSASSEGFLLLPVVLAWVCSKNERAVLAGALLAVAVLLKQPAVFFIIPIAYNLWRGSRGRRGLALALVSLGAMAAVCVVVGVWYGLDEFVFWNLSGNSSYLFSRPPHILAARALGATVLFVFGHLVAVWLAARAWPDRRQHIDLWLWLAAAIVGVSVGQRFSGHYYLMLLPPLVALAAPQLGAYSRRTIATALVITTLVPWAVLTWAPQPDLADPEQAVVAIDVHSEPDDSLLVWGVFPEAYWASGRPMATRFPHTNFVTGVNQSEPTEGAVGQLCADLERSQPELILDMSDTGLRSAGRSPMRDFAPVQPVLEAYEPVVEIDDGDLAGAVLYRRSGPWRGCDAGS